MVVIAVLIVKKARNRTNYNFTEQPLAENPANVSISKKELELVFDTIPEEICIIDKNFTIVRANKSLANAVKLPVKDLIGEVCYKLFWNRNLVCRNCPAKIAFDNNYHAPLLKKQISHMNNDRAAHYEISAFPVVNDSGQVYHVIEIRKDITDEKRMIEYMIRSEKLASVGNMTAGIAHEMNNPLSGISGNAANLLKMPEKYGLNEKGRCRVTAILELATRATSIMTDLLHLSQRPGQLCILSDINELLQKTIDSIHLTGSLDIKHTFAFQPGLPRLYCDPLKIQQVIIHLITNATLAINDKKNTMPGNSDYNGVIHVATELKDRQLHISFSDNGIGVAEEISNKIFDPFFSTRPTGQGTGLGLSVSNKIVEEHGGKMFFECIDGLTIFTLQFPLQSDGN